MIQYRKGESMAMALGPNPRNRKIQNLPKNDQKPPPGSALSKTFQ